MTVELSDSNIVAHVRTKLPRHRGFLWKAQCSVLRALDSPSP